MSDLTPEVLRIQMAVKGLSRLQLCLKSKVSRYRLYLFEQGVISLRPDELRRICHGIDLPLSSNHSKKGKLR